MEHQWMSLLYPTRESADNPTEQLHVVATDNVCDDLGLSTVLGLKNSTPSAYISQNPAVLEYRQDMFRDMLAHKELEEVLTSLLPLLCDITELRKLGEAYRGDSGESYLYSITEIELYISCIQTLQGGLAPILDNLDSEAFKRLGNFVTELTHSEYYIELNENLKKLTSRMQEVKSITIGVNLDASLRPVEAGVVSVNAEKFHSGSTLDKILRMSFRHDAMTCIASLSPMGKGQSDNRKEALVGAFLSALEDVFHSSVKGWRKIVGTYVLENTDFLLRMLPEIEFVCAGTRYVHQLEKKGYTPVMPEICPMADKTFSAEGLFNPDVALRIDDTIVANDFAFDEKARIFVITGPNRGGKSVHTTAVGIAQCMAQMGLPVAARSAKISPVDKVLTHFPQGAEDTIDKGRLGEECARLKDMFEVLTEHSLLLLDESLSSTGAFEATYIASDILLGFGLARCRGIFSTHLHDLAAAVPQISQRSTEGGGVAIDTMTAEMNADGSRSFRVIRATPDGKSYATDIARKYGLASEQILEMVKHAKAPAPSETNQ